MHGMVRKAWDALKRPFTRGQDIADLPPHVCNLCHARVNSVWTLGEWFVCDGCYERDRQARARRRADGSEEVTPQEAAGHTHAITVNIVGPPPEELERMAENLARVTAQSGVSAREAMQQMGQVMSRSARTMRSFESAFQGRPMLECTEGGEHNWIAHEDVRTMEIVRMCDVCGFQERMSLHEQEEPEILERRTVDGRVERILATMSGRTPSRAPNRSNPPRQGSSAQAPAVPAPAPAPDPFVQLGAPRKRPVILDD